MAAELILETPAVVLGAHTHKTARGANNVQSLTSDGRWSAREMFSQWLRGGRGGGAEVARGLDARVATR